MSKIRLEYEILVSGIYPFEGTFEKCDFRIVKNRVDDSLFNSLAKESVIYISPFIGMCCYPDETGVPVYLTFQKEELIEVDYGNKEEYDLKTTNKFIEELQEYVRKVLLMYWIVSMNNKQPEHGEIIKEIQSQNYKNSIMYRNFLTAFDNTPFQEKRIKILTDTCPQVLTK